MSYGLRLTSGGLSSMGCCRSGKYHRQVHEGWCEPHPFILSFIFFPVFLFFRLFYFFFVYPGKKYTNIKNIISENKKRLQKKNFNNITHKMAQYSKKSFVLPHHSSLSNPLKNFICRMSRVENILRTLLDRPKI